MATQEALRAAAVALVVAEDPGRLLMIRRAEHPQDPWSGHVALPGGRVDPSDGSSLATAMRETFEEVGVALEPNLLWGSLPTTQAFASSARPRFAVTPHLFVLPELPSLRPDPSEVAEAFWVPLSDLRNPERRMTYSFAGGSSGPASGREFPAIEYKGRVIWGLTYTILRQFIEIFPTLR